MALFLHRGNGPLPVTSKLKLLPPAVPESACPVYVLDDSESDCSDYAPPFSPFSSSLSSDEEDDAESVYFEALEEPLPPKEPVVLPEELLDGVMAHTQDEGEDQSVLRNASLVCRRWSGPARRRLFSQLLAMNNVSSVKRLRSVLEARPELARAARRVDLSNPGSAWQDNHVGEVYRRAAGLLRMTKNVREVSLLHVALNDKTRSKLFNALKSLPVATAFLYSSTWTSFGRNGAIRSAGGGTPDMEALAHLLCTWRSLKTLTLSGYSSYPRLFSASIAPAHTLPTYQLVDLTLISVDLSHSTLLWLLGSSGKSLKRLNLAATSGLSKDVLKHVFELVGPTLEVLLLSLDIDDLHPSSSSEPLDNAILSPLTALTSFSLSTDTVFADTVLSELVDSSTHPNLSTVSLCFPSFDFLTVLSALSSIPVGEGGALKSLVLDAWENAMLWTDAQRWEVLQVCKKRGVGSVSLNGLGREEIEDDWYGEDVSADWGFLERAEQARRGSRVRPIWR
ncbi:hypothetical protein JCM8547_005306 [Rhodosporidiobolus lusitaniae]